MSRRHVGGRSAMAGALAAVVAASLACAGPDDGVDSSLADGATATIRVGEFSDVGTFDPVLTQPTQAAYLTPVYDTLLRQDADHELVAHLATAWEQVDPVTVRFTLRDDVTFHDGSRFDAAAVEANLERAKATDGNPNAATFVTMREVVALDPTTVEVRFETPAPTFLRDMSLVPGMMVSPAALADGVDLTRRPHGSGGWVWNAAASEEATRYVYDANPDYWAPHLQGVGRFEISVVADNDARYRALQAGQVDLVHAATPSQAVAAGAEGYDVVQLDVDAHFILVTDRAGRRTPALGDRRVRQAIGHAIDRAGYVHALLEDEGSSDGGLVSPALEEWYDGELAALPRFDPAAARRLLAEAGYADGFDLTLPTLPLLQANNEAIAQMLADVGIDVELTPLQNGELGPEMRKGSFGAGFAVVTQYHPDQTLRLFASDDGPYNPFGVHDTGTIDAALAAAAGAREQPIARAHYAAAEREAIDEGIIIPVAFAPVVNVAAEEVDGMVMPLGARHVSPFGLRIDGS